MEEEDKVLELKQFFLKENKFNDHFTKQNSQTSLYQSVLKLLVIQGIELSAGTKSRILAAAWARKDAKFADYLINGIKEQNVKSGKPESQSYTFGLVEILRALNLLDSKRKIRQLEKKLQRYEHEKAAKSKTIGATKAKINELKKEEVSVGSVSGSLARFVAKWVSQIPANFLEFYALNLPKDPWKELTNLCHLKAKDFKLSWFLDFVYDKGVPPDSMVAECSNLFEKDENTIEKLLIKYQIPYSFIRRNKPDDKGAKTKGTGSRRRGRGRSRGSRGRGSSRGRGRGRGGARGGTRGGRGARGGAARGGRGRGRGRGGRGRGGRGRGGAPKAEDPNSNENETIPKEEEKKILTPFTEKMKAILAGYSAIDSILWYHEELGCETVDNIIQERLKKGEWPSFSYGKLMERLMYCKKQKIKFFEDLIPIAEKRLKEISLPLDPPVIVIGDASSSMSIAISTATIISSLLTVLANAELRFFNGSNFGPKKVPKTIREVLEVAEETKATGSTNPAASLWPSYESKTKVNIFIIVTDEGENGSVRGDNFAKLFKKYLDEVYSEAKVVFVSFLSDPNRKGKMVKDLESKGIIPIQFKLDSSRPDLTKLDTLLGILSAESSQFKKNALKTATSISSESNSN